MTRPRIHPASLVMPFALMLGGCTREAYMVFVAVVLGMLVMGLATLTFVTAILVTWIRTTRSSTSVAVGLLYGGACAAFPFVVALDNLDRLAPGHDDQPFYLGLFVVFGLASLVTLVQAVKAMSQPAVMDSPHEDRLEVDRPSRPSLF